MKRSLTRLAGFVLLCFVLAACGTVPLTGRSQFTIIPESQMLAMSFSQYGDFLQTNQLSTSREKSEQVKRVGKRIQNAAETYLRQNGMSDELKGYQWEFNLVRDDQVNAWAMPGGKIVVYEGILPVTQNDEGLAVVMAHEIAHAVAKHGNERMTQQLLTQMGGMALTAAISEKPAETQKLWLSAVGLGSQFGLILPYSRLHEKEADRMGMLFMALAGYDPAGAVSFWSRMAKQSGGASPPEFLSTHPSDATRIREMQKHLPEAKRYYKPSK